MYLGIEGVSVWRWECVHEFEVCLGECVVEIVFRYVVGYLCILSYLWYVHECDDDRRRVACVSGVVYTVYDMGDGGFWVCCELGLWGSLEEVCDGAWVSRRFRGKRLG